MRIAFQPSWILKAACVGVVQVLSDPGLLFYNKTARANMHYKAKRYREARGNE